MLSTLSGTILAGLIATSISFSAVAQETAPSIDPAALLDAAVLADDAGLVAEAIAAGADPLDDSDGITPLYTALATANRAAAAAISDALPPALRAAALAETLAGLIADGNASGVGVALEIGADPNGLEGLGAAALAVAAGDATILRLVLDAGAEPDGEINGAPALLLAMAEDRASMVEALIDAGADVDAKVDGAPLLVISVVLGGAYTDALVQAGADLDATDADGATAATAAAAIGLDDLAEQLSLRAYEVVWRLIERLGRVRYTAVARRLGDFDFTQRLSDGTPVFHEFVGRIAEQMHQYRTSQDRPTYDPTEFSAYLEYRDGRHEWIRGMVRDHPEIKQTLAVVNNNGEGILDQVLRAGSGDIRNLIFSSVISEMTPQEARAALLRENAEGVSAFNRLITEGREKGDYFRGLDLAEEAWLSSIVREVATEKDSFGLSPIEATILSDNAEMVTELYEAGVRADQTGRTLHDLARAAEAWRSLAQLPYDRRLPPITRGLRPDSEKRALQRALRDYGYYTGAIDGVIGAGSRAALQAFLRDSAEELFEIARAVLRDEPAGVETGPFSIYFTRYQSAVRLANEDNYFTTVSVSYRDTGCLMNFSLRSDIRWRNRTVDELDSLRDFWATCRNLIRSSQSPTLFWSRFHDGGLTFSP